MDKRVVVALGHKALGTNFPQQFEAVSSSVKYLADLVENGCQLLITHSNAPQVGMIHTALNEYAKKHETYNAAMSICSSMSQGFIGYDIQNLLRPELISRGIYRTVSTIITQVVVDPYDDAFYHPIKIIGRYLTQAEAEAEEAKGNYAVEVELPEGTLPDALPDGYQEGDKLYRRIVASPKPIDIVEIDAITALLDAGQIVIAAGGGGIPVLRQPHRLKSASAIVEKDLTAGRLADLTDADVLMIFTSEDQVAIHYHTDSPKNISHMTGAEALKYIEAGEFDENGMLPKIEASVNFVSQKAGRRAIITSIEHALDALNGKAGTLIEP